MPPPPIDSELTRIPKASVIATPERAARTLITHCATTSFETRCWPPSLIGGTAPCVLTASARSPTITPASPTLDLRSRIIDRDD